jgi:hypothetical protein
MSKLLDRLYARIGKRHEVVIRTWSFALLTALELSNVLPIQRQSNIDRG